MWQHNEGVATPGFTAVVLPNIDTLYSTVWLRLPARILVPNVHPSLYYLITLLDENTNVVGSFGSRTQRGDGPYAISARGAGLVWAIARFALHRDADQTRRALGVQQGPMTACTLSWPSDSRCERPSDALASAWPAEWLARARAWPLGPLEAGCWQLNRSQLGRFGPDTRLRAATALKLLGANLCEDALYAFAERDSAGETLRSDASYEMRLHARPPCHPRAFWSLTVYDWATLQLIDSPQRAYAVQSYDHRQFPLSVRASPTKPSSSVAWLATCGTAGSAPKRIVLVLRIYWPLPSSACWNPPPIVRVG